MGISWYPDRDVDPSLKEHRTDADGNSLWSCRRCDHFFLVIPKANQLLVIPARHRQAVTWWYERRPLVGAEHAEVLERIGGAPTFVYPHRPRAHTYPCRCTTKAGEDLDYCVLSVQEFPPVGGPFHGADRLLLIDEIDRIETSDYSLNHGIRLATRTARQADRDFWPTVVAAPDGSEFILNARHDFFATKAWKGPDMRPGRQWEGAMGRDEYRMSFPETWIVASGILRLPPRTAANGFSVDQRGLAEGASHHQILLPRDLISLTRDQQSAAALYDQGLRLYHQSVQLGKLGGNEEAIAAYEGAIAAYDEIDARFGDRDELPLAELVAKALVNKGLRLEARGRSREAIAAYNRVEARFGDRDELPLAENVAKALVNKGLSLGILDRDEEAIVVCDQVVARFSDREELPLAKKVAKALRAKGTILHSLGRSAEAIAVYEQVVARFGEGEDLPLAEDVASALHDKAACLLTLGSRSEAGSESRRRCWQQAEQTLITYARRTGKPLLRVYPYARLLALRGEESEALRALEECLKADSISVQRLRRASDWDALRSRADFDALLRRYASASTAAEKSAAAAGKLEMSMADALGVWGPLLRHSSRSEADRVLRGILLDERLWVRVHAARSLHFIHRLELSPESRLIYRMASEDPQERKEALEEFDRRMADQSAATAVESPGGYGEWKLGMSRAEVSSLEEWGPYEAVEVTGGLETRNGVFAGQRTTISFVFRQDALRKIQIWAYEGEDRDEALAAWQRVYRHLESGFGTVESPDLGLAEVANELELRERSVEAIAVTPATDTAKVQIAPEPMPQKISVSSSFIRHPDYGFGVFLYYQEPRQPDRSGGDHQAATEGPPQ